MKHTVWPAFTAAALAALVSAIAVEATPHVRGLGYFPELRFVSTTLACALTAVLAAALQRSLGSRWLGAAMGSLAALLLLGMALWGPRGLVAAAWPAVLAAALTITLVLPRVRGARTWVALLGAGELALACLALSSESTATSAAAEHSFIDLPSGARVHYIDEGEGPTLLFLHGNPAWSFQWRGLIEGLRGRFRCVALDYPGFGLSSAPAGYGYTAREQSVVVEEFVHQLGLHDLTLVMQDWGGPIGLGFATRNPELVRAVVLGSTWAWPTTTSEPRGKFSFLAGGPVGEFVQMNFNGFASFGVRHGVVRELSASELELYLQPFVPLDRRGIAAFYPGQINADVGYFRELEAGLPALRTKPALIFWALLDQGFPRPDLQRWQRLFPGHQTVELAAANHFFFEDAAATMIPRIGAFMQTQLADARQTTSPD